MYAPSSMFSNFHLQYLSFFVADSRGSQIHASLNHYIVSLCVHVCVSVGGWASVREGGHARALMCVCVGGGGINIF